MAFHRRLAIVAVLLTCCVSSLQPAFAQKLQYTHPAIHWEKEGLPIGNGSLGGVLTDPPNENILQFNVDSFWTGDENPGGSYDFRGTSQPNAFGSYQNFGAIHFEHDSADGGKPDVSNPDNLATSQHETIAASFDCDPATKWCMEHHGHKIVWQVDLKHPQKLSAYKFTSGNDVPGRDPSTWKLEGSTDEKTWKTIDQQTDVDPMKHRKETVRYPVDCPTPYRYYRFTFDPRPGVPHFQVAEIELENIRLSFPASPVSAYHRELDIANAVHTTTWKKEGVTFTQKAIASHPDQVIAWHFTADAPGKINGTIRIAGAHDERDQIEQAEAQLRLHGELFNHLKYAACVQVLHSGGKIIPHKKAIECVGCDEVTILLAADTNYVMSRAAGWMEGDPAPRVQSRLATASKKSWPQLLADHQADYHSLFNRVQLDLGKTDPALADLPTDQRIGQYRAKAKDLPRPCLDPELEATLFQYGRYLLISCSRPGSLPANLQGLWCHSNRPAWHSDYHTNINLQMNYWLAETANLPELAEPLFAMLDAGVPVYREHSEKKYGKTGGFTTRMSINPYGGGGWNWNIEGTAWLAQHYWEHYAFSGDQGFLEQQAWPWMRDVSRFWLARLKKLPNGKLVVPNAWSHEHGPYEDGTAHAQQQMFDLFTHTLQAAKILNTEPELQAKLEKTIQQLEGPKIGSWGQLMEWREEKPDLEKSHHRHTSHLFAVYPGSQITLHKTPKLAQGAIVSLTQRGEVGDSRRSWTWAWRTALWARLGKPERAHGCVAGLLAHNTTNNLWTTHPPYQIDGNLGITAGIVEMLVQSHSGAIEILPALPKVWPTGSVTGLRLRGGHTIDIEWADGKLTKATLHPGQAGDLEIVYAQQTKTFPVHPGEPIHLTPDSW